MPRKKLKPTEDQRRHVKSLAAVGIKPEDIARYIRVSERTFLKYYKEETFRGPLEANVKVGKAFLDMSSSGEKPVASIFWLKSRGGFQESQGGSARSEATPDFVVALEKKAA